MKNIFKQEEISFKVLDSNVSRKVLAYGKEIMMVEVFFEQGGVGAIHSHPHAQTCYILEGKFEFNVDGVKHQVNKGDTLYFPSNMSHGTLCLEKGSLLDVFTPCREDFINE